jgi:hypothetical protein
MLDLNFLIEQEDLNRKSSLLKNVKLTFESLLFDRSNASYNSLWHNFNGNVNRFCRSILEILHDGFILDQTATQPAAAAAAAALSSSNQSNSVFKFSSSGSTNSTQAGSTDNLAYHKSLWTFLVQFYTDELANSTETCSRTALLAFKTIYEQLLNSQRIMESNSYSPSSDFYQQQQQQQQPNDLITDSTNDWIFASLRHHKLHPQLQCMVENRRLLEKCYTNNAFVLDSSFLADFLLYVQAFESDDYTVLSGVRNVGINILIEEQRRTSNRSSRVDLNEIVVSGGGGGADVNGPLLLTATTLTTTGHDKFVKQHRRIHSFPNMQINLFKKSPVAVVAAGDGSAASSISTSQNESSNNNNNDSTLYENQLDGSVSQNSSSQNMSISEKQQQLNQQWTQSTSSTVSVPKFTLNSEPIEVESQGNSSFYFFA